MSKRGQETTSSEGSPMAKPKPMFPAEGETCQLGVTQPVNDDEGQSDHTGTKRLVRTTQNLEVQRSQVWRQDNAQSSDSWKQCDQEEASNSTSTKRLGGTATPRPEFQNMKYTKKQYMTNISHFLQKKLGITAGYSTVSMEELKTSVSKCGMFMSSSMKAAIHVGPTYLANLEVYKKRNFEEIESLFDITQNLILEHSEDIILNVNMIDNGTPSWTRSVLSHDQVIRWTEAKVRVYSDSVPMLGKDE